jgi:PmbA protein
LPAGPPLRLAETGPPPPWAPPSDLETALLGESEAAGLFEALGKAIAKEVPGAELRAASLEEGTSESEVLSTRGAKARWRSRNATLTVEAVDRGSGRGAVRMEFAERSAQRLQPALVARRLADRLHVEAQGVAPDRDRGEFLLAPSVAARLLAEFSPYLLGPRAPARIEPLRDRRGRVAAEAVSILDNGRFADGLLSAPVDGEGIATREVTIVEEGVFRQPLLAWWQARPPFDRFSGCSRRDSWRDLPRPGPTHLYVKPRADTSVAMLLSAVARGYYLLDLTGRVRLDLESERFWAPVCGFAVVGGRASNPVAGAWLCGSVGGFLRNVTGVGRDLLFQPLDGMIGSPSLLVTGLELRRDPKS